MEHFWEMGRNSAAARRTQWGRQPPTVNANKISQMTRWWDHYFLILYNTASPASPASPAQPSPARTAWPLGPGHWGQPVIWVRAWGMMFSWTQSHIKGLCLADGMQTFKWCLTMSGLESTMHREETPSQPEIGIFVFKTFTDRFAKILKTGHPSVLSEENLF